jgi:hypothetical protein
MKAGLVDSDHPIVAAGDSPYAVLKAKIMCAVDHCRWRGGSIVSLELIVEDVVVASELSV